MKNDDKSAKPIFTPRQLEILHVWSREPSVAKAAERMSISYHTIETQLKRMRKKLNVSRTVDVYIYARDRQMLTLELDHETSL